MQASVLKCGGRGEVSKGKWSPNPVCCMLLERRSAGTMYHNSLSPVVCKQVFRALQVPTPLPRNLPTNTNCI